MPAAWDARGSIGVVAPVEAPGPSGTKRDRVPGRGPACQRPGVSLVSSRPVRPSGPSEGHPDPGSAWWPAMRGTTGPLDWTLATDTESTEASPRARTGTRGPGRQCDRGSDGGRSPYDKARSRGGSRTGTVSGGRHGIQRYPAEIQVPGVRVEIRQFGASLEGDRPAHRRVGIHQAVAEVRIVAAGSAQQTRLDRGGRQDMADLRPVRAGSTLQTSEAMPARFGAAAEVPPSV